MINARQHRDAGFALPVSIVLTVVALILMIAAAAYTMGRVGDQDRRRDRVVAMPVVDSAITRLKFGLEQNLLAEHNDYMPTADHLTTLVAGTPADAIPGSPIAPPLPPDMPNVTIREPMGNGQSGFWQLVKVFAPDYGAAEDQGVVVAYLRAWTAPTNEPGGGTEPQLVRIEFRPGRFADYQAVIDGPIVFTAGATLNGPIHSNGFPDERANLKDSIDGKAERVTTVDNADVNCSGAAQITTAEGAVDATHFPGCPIQVNTGRYVNLLAAEESFGRIRKACADNAANVHCYAQAYDGSNVPTSLAQRPPDLRGYRVRLSHTSIEVSRYEVNYMTEAAEPIPGEPVETIPTPDGSTNVLFFPDNVIVSGTTTARVTIAARKPGLNSGYVQSGASNIYLGGDVGYGGAKGVLGLLSQGGVMLDAIKEPDGTHPCIQHVRAGIIAMSGTLTIDPRYTTRLYQEGGPTCGAIEISGSLAAHRSPVLYWDWDNVAGYAGYSSRNYRWTEELRSNPPPYFPTTDTWESRHVRPANLDCFSGGDITDPKC